MKFVLFVLAIIGSSLADPFAQNKENTIAIPEGLTFKDFFPANESNTDNERIIGGTPAPIERFPWQLSLRGRVRHICGGSILSATRGLTAAHCIIAVYPPRYYIVLAGTTNRLDESTGFLTPLSRFIVHPQWHRPTVRHDIAVLWFANPLPLRPTIRPIALPPQNAPVAYGVQGVVSGWGLTREGNFSSGSTVLLYTVANTFTNQQCNRAYLGRVTADMVCAGVLEGGRGTCQGDSGGPLVVNGVQVGIVSWARGCAQPNFPSVYTRVSYFIDWIRSVV